MKIWGLNRETGRAALVEHDGSGGPAKQALCDAGEALGMTPEAVFTRTFGSDDYPYSIPEAAENIVALTHIVAEQSRRIVELERKLEERG